MSQGTTVPPSTCGTAYINLFGMNDSCSGAVQELFSGNISAIINLLSGGCPMRFQAYVNACITDDDDDEVCM